MLYPAPSFFEKETRKMIDVLTWHHMIVGVFIGLSLICLGLKFGNKIVAGIGAFMFMFCASYLG